MTAYCVRLLSAVCGGCDILSFLGAWTRLCLVCGEVDLSCVCNMDVDGLSLHYNKSDHGDFSHAAVRQLERWSLGLLVL